ncbi:hypothetical protein MUN89_19035 [Halobacillus salinarum]|uniref:Uncharacterized protein n=1 Tax=Halobacillus salinarum TaxID=2932257 RepID=A0ABY4EK87_9BACI|nr:hypothetical protein [Halobacillus salinarum]UOQ43937.1 hypothetical protein MUN89_19035 [Halobacillus salinarum]
METYRDHESSSHYQGSPKNMKDSCQQHLYQFIQIQMQDGSVYQGMLHSYDDEKMYVIMPNQNVQQAQASQAGQNRFFPFFGPFGLFGFPFFGIRAFGPFFPFWW